MKTYHGERMARNGACLVFVNNPANEFRRWHVLAHVKVHSTALEWGYGGSGPNDLAVSILADYLGEKPEMVKAYAEHGGWWGERCEICAGEGYVEILPAPEVGDRYTSCTGCEGLGYHPNPESKAWRWHHEFLRQFVLGMEHDTWTLSEAEVAVFVERMKKADALDEARRNHEESEVPW